MVNLCTLRLEKAHERVHTPPSVASNLTFPACWVNIVPSSIQRPSSLQGLPQVLLIR